MTKLEIIALIITIISMFCFSAVFTLMFSHYCKVSCDEIISGKKDIELLDNELTQKKKNKNNNKVLIVIRKVISYLVIGLLCFLLSLSIISKVTKNVMPLGNSALLTVASGSMSFKNSANKYLDDNNLNNQFQTYDIIVIHHVEEDDLKLFDVIAYRNNENKIIIHRIVRIEDTIDGKKYYTRGDANNKTDEFISSYKDVVGRYTNQRVPILGIFILFLQSYSGLTTICAIVYCIIMFDKQYAKLNRVSQSRLNTLLGIIKNPTNINDFKTSYVQYIYYQGNIYTFEDGNFKKKITNENNNNIDSNTLFVVSKNDNNVQLESNNLANNNEQLTQEEKSKTISEIESLLNEKE